MRWQDAVPERMACARGSLKGHSRFTKKKNEDATDRCCVVAAKRSHFKEQRRSWIERT
jgi:hypothetical protein